MVPSVPSTPSSRERGSWLVDAVIAAAILVSALSGIAQLLLISRRAVWESGASTAAVVLAAQRLEQLRSLTWAFDPAGNAVSDETTDLSADPPSGGGTGLRTSPEGTLRNDVAGFVDYLDASGGWRGNGGAAPEGAVFVRRWAIAPLASDPLHTLVLQVTVAPLAVAAVDDPVRSRLAATLTTIRTRGVE